MYVQHDILNIHVLPWEILLESKAILNYPLGLISIPKAETKTRPCSVVLGGRKPVSARDHRRDKFTMSYSACRRSYVLEADRVPTQRSGGYWSALDGLIVSNMAITTAGGECIRLRCKIEVQYLTQRSCCVLLMRR